MTKHRKTINSIISFTTILVIGIVYFFDGTVDETNNEAKVFIIFVLLLTGFLNVIYLDLVYYTRLSKGILVSTKWTLIETVIFLLIYFGVFKILDSISENIANEIAKPFGKNGELINVGKNIYLSFPFDFIYTFIILTIVIFIFEKKIQKKKS